MYVIYSCVCMIYIHIYTHTYVYMYVYICQCFPDNIYMSVSVFHINMYIHICCMENTDWCRGDGWLLWKVLIKDREGREEGGIFTAQLRRLTVEGQALPCLHLPWCCVQLQCCLQETMSQVAHQYHLPRSWPAWGQHTHSQRGWLCRKQI